MEKFKNTEEFKKAYKELEKEYTKKCQQITKLEHDNHELRNYCVQEDVKRDKQCAKCEKLYQKNKTEFAIKQIYLLLDLCSNHSDLIKINENEYTFMLDMYELTENAQEVIDAILKKLN